MTSATRRSQRHWPNRMQNPDPATPGVTPRCRCVRPLRQAHAPMPVVGLGFFLCCFVLFVTCSFHRNTTRCPLTFCTHNRTRSLWYTVQLHREFPGLLSLLVVVNTFPSYFEDTPCVSFFLLSKSHHTTCYGDIGRVFYCWSYSFLLRSAADEHFSFPFYCTNSIITIHRAALFPARGRTQQSRPIGKRNGSLPGWLCCCPRRMITRRTTHTHTHTPQGKISLGLRSQRHDQRGRWLMSVCQCVTHRIPNDQHTVSIQSSRAGRGWAILHQQQQKLNLRT